MSNESDKNEQDIYDEEITDDDFGFILGPDGELKSLFFPVDETAEIPETVQMILEIFGITDISDVDEKPTLH